METFLYIVFFVSCIVLVGSVLLQPGKTDAGALFTSGVSSAAMNPRGTASVLSKLTIFAATIFMLSALLLTLPAISGDVSVLQTQGENSTGGANANTNVENTNATNSNTEEANAENMSDEPEEDSKENGKPDDETDSKEDANSEDKSESNDGAKDEKPDAEKADKEEGK